MNSFRCDKARETSLCSWRFKVQVDNSHHCMSKKIISTRVGQLDPWNMSECIAPMFPLVAQNVVPLSSTWENYTVQSFPLLDLSRFSVRYMAKLDGHIPKCSHVFWNKVKSLLPLNTRLLDVEHYCLSVTAFISSFQRHWSAWTDNFGKPRWPALLQRPQLT